MRFERIPDKKILLCCLCPNLKWNSVYQGVVECYASAESLASLTGVACIEKI